MSSKIRFLRGREVYNGVGEPTIECEIGLGNYGTVHANVSSGTSRGSREGFELRDQGKRLFGLGVEKAVRIIDQELQPLLIGKEPDGTLVDELLTHFDRTTGFQKIGANTALAVSMAAWRAEATVRNIPLWQLIGYFTDCVPAIPAIIVNMFSGGAHAAVHVAIQECNIVQTHAMPLPLWLELCAMLTRYIAQNLREYGIMPSVSIEGGYQAAFIKDEDLVSFLAHVFKNLPTPMQETFGFYLDIAATTFYSKQKHTYLFGKNSLSSAELIDVYEKICSKIPVKILEDGMAETDIEGWSLLQQMLGKTVIQAGDDLCSSDISCIKAHAAVASGIVIKPIQIGTITKSLNAIDMCRQHGLTPILSHRSRETEDTFIADLSVGTAVPYLKTGGMFRGERIIKYNRLLRIYDTLNTKSG